MNTPPSTLPVLLRHPSVFGLSRITSSLYLSNGVAANNKALLSSNQITTVINVSVERGGAAGPHAPALRGGGQQERGPVHRLPDEVPRHVPAGRPRLDQVLPAHRPAQQRLLGAAHPLR
uniref:Uncharacterized protein n=1 Tax=Ornithorhynchus anatinus TaxID=9258 RepID=A0A6I8MZ11_ORNAN